MQLESRIRELEAALTPFATTADAVEAAWKNKEQITDYTLVFIEVGLLRKAREALQGNGS